MSKKGRPIDTEKRKRVEQLLLHPKWRCRSTKWIAERAHTSRHLVQMIRAQMGLVAVRVETKNGRTYPRGVNRRFG